MAIIPALTHGPTSTSPHDATGCATAVNTNAGSQITNWVTAHYTSTTVDGYTIYDLTQPTGD
jgi:hypothetical protein